MKLCFRCKERPAEKGYCAECQTEYNRIWKSNHRKNPPRGELKGNWRKAERDFPAPPITMAYITPNGKEVIHGFCKERLHFIGTAEARYGKEIRFFCSRCVEAVILPEVIMERLQVWCDDPTWNRLHAGGLRSDGGNLVPA